MTDFPKLDEAAVWQVALVLRLLQEDPHYLDNAPYPSAVKDFFTRWKKQEVIILNNTVDLDTLDLESEAKLLYGQMKKIQLEIEDMEVKDRLSYLKIAYGLLDKLLLLQERASNVKAYAKFQLDVLQIMEELVSPEQRTAIMDRLQELK